MLDFEKNLLPNTTKRYNVNFVGVDSEDNFINNCKKLPPSWHYRTKIINYKSNSLKYRTDEFESIKWDESIILLGCSMVFGTGLAEDETISFQIEKITGIKTVNMGIGGASMWHSLTNLVGIFNMGLRPFAIVNVWSAIERFLYYINNSPTAINQACLDKDKSFDKDFFILWTHDDSHIKSLATTIQNTSKIICNNTKYYECTFFKHTSNALKIDHLEYNDQARDCAHPGPLSAQLAAVNIVNNLKLT